MKTLLLTITLTFLTLQSSALAQNSQVLDPAHRFAGYEPTILENESQASTLFHTMEDRFKPLSPFTLQFGSQCTERAETWTYDWYALSHVNSQKVFVFYTHAFKAWYKEHFGKNFKWWFHVSPYLLVKNAEGEVTERVMDAEFSRKPQTMKEWTDLFIESKQECIENVPFANFEGDVSESGASYNKNAHCYIVRAPMYDMYPMNIDARERGLNSKMEWNLEQVRTGASALKAKARANFKRRVGLSQ